MLLRLGSRIIGTTQLVAVDFGARAADGESAARLWYADDTGETIIARASPAYEALQHWAATLRLPEWLCVGKLLIAVCHIREIDADRSGSATVTSVGFWRHFPHGTPECDAFLDAVAAALS